MSAEQEALRAHQALIARQHFETFQEANRAKKAFDFKKCLGLISSYEEKAQILIDAGWSEYEIGANALGLKVSHYRDLVKEGIYRLGVGMPVGARDQKAAAPQERCR